METQVVSCIMMNEAEEEEEVEGREGRLDRKFFATLLLVYYHTVLFWIERNV